MRVFDQGFRSWSWGTHDRRWGKRRRRLHLIMENLKWGKKLKEITWTKDPGPSNSMLVKKDFFYHFFFIFNNQIKYMSRETVGTNRISVLRIKKWFSTKNRKKVKNLEKNLREITWRARGLRTRCFKFLNFRFLCKIKHIWLKIHKQYNRFNRQDQPTNEYKSSINDKHEKKIF